MDTARTTSLSRGTSCRRPPLAPLAPHQPRPARDGDAMLFESLYAFFQEHQYCGELDGGVDDDWVSLTCTCGARSQRLPPQRTPRLCSNVLENRQRHPNAQECVSEGIIK